MESSTNFLDILNEKIEEYQKGFKDPGEAEFVKKMWDKIQTVMATNPSIKTASPRKQYDKVIQLLMQEVAGSAGDLMRAFKSEMACKGKTNSALIAAENDSRWQWR